jgi:UTP--glucose-1-phosphate uridylyltransferase
MNAVIPAGGLGTRFAPLSRFVPKELFLLGDRPLIHHALDEAASSGFETAVVVVSPAKIALRRYLQEVTTPLQVEVVDQPEAAGPGDAVLRALARTSPPFGVLLPDDVILGREHWSELLRGHEATGAALLTLRRVPAELAHRFGIAACSPEGEWLRVENLVEKPAPGTVPSDLAVLGRYVVTQAVVAALEGARARSGGELELTQGFAAAISCPPGVLAVQFDGEFFDCGTPLDYRRSAARFPFPDGNIFR